MPAKAFVIGHPIAHSRSPHIHNFWLQSLGIAGSYAPVDVAPEALPAFVNALRQGAYAGGNVTIPHKQQALALCDQVTPEAREIGAVNTLVAQNGLVFGSNTDITGFLANLDDQAPGWDAARGTAIVLGAGGAARAILVGLRQRGFERIHILNRTEATARSLAEEFSAPFSAHELSEFDQLAPRADLVVNTTAIGMHGTSFEGLALGRLPKAAVVADIVYTPLETPLLAQARRRGLRTADGLGMLLHQAVPGFAAWFGATPQVSPQLRRAIEKTLEVG